MTEDQTPVECDCPCHSPRVAMLHIINCCVTCKHCSKRFRRGGIRAHEASCVANTEVEFVDHCDDGSCGLGTAKYVCPRCEHNGTEYGELWFLRDKLFSDEAKVVSFICEKCRTRLEAYRKEGSGVYVRWAGDHSELLKKIQTTVEKKEGE